MSGGPKKQQTASVSSVPAAQIPEQTDFSQYTPQGVGPTKVNQTFTAQGKPKWMKGIWDMPDWGKGAAMGAELTNQNLSAAPYTPPAAPQSQQSSAGPGSSNSAYLQYLAQLRQQMAFSTPSGDGGIYGGPGYNYLTTLGRGYQSPFGGYNG